MRPRNLLTLAVSAIVFSFALTGCAMGVRYEPPFPANCQQAAAEACGDGDYVMQDEGDNMYTVDCGGDGTVDFTIIINVENNTTVTVEGDETNNSNDNSNGDDDDTDTGDDELTECNDGIDNDGDGAIDLDDEGCDDEDDNSEVNADDPEEEEYEYCGLSGNPEPEDAPTGYTLWFGDSDGDGYGNSYTWTCKEDGTDPNDQTYTTRVWVTENTDCMDDADGWSGPIWHGWINPGAVELGDGVDNDCDGVADNGCSDACESSYEWDGGEDDCFDAFYKADRADNDFGIYDPYDDTSRDVMGESVTGNVTCDMSEEDQQDPLMAIDVYAMFEAQFGTPPE